MGFRNAYVVLISILFHYGFVSNGTSRLRLTIRKSMANCMTQICIIFLSQTRVDQQTWLLILVE